MKVRCKCGAAISDTSDFLCNKGYMVPDQDLEDLQDTINDNQALDMDPISIYSKTMYQCEECSCLIFELNNELHFFLADDPQKSIHALRSVMGEQWKRQLRGNWVGDKGTLWWGFGVEDEGFDFDITSWEALSNKYYETFARLKRKGVLRNCFLRKDGEMIHVWPKKE